MTRTKESKNYTLKTNVVGSAINRLFPWLQDKDDFTELLRAIALEIQEAENSVGEFYNNLVVEDASGELLQFWAEIMGVENRGLTDENLRRFVAHRTQVNRSAGTIDTLISIFENIAEGTVQFWTSYPAGVVLETVRSSDLSFAERREIWKFMGDAIQAGTGFTLIEAEEGAFRFDDSNNGFDNGTWLAKVIDEVDR